MKKKLILIALLISGSSFISCDWDEVFSRPVDLKFVPYWGDQMVYGNILNSFVFQNHNGETVSINNLTFVISDIQFKKLNGDIYAPESEYSIFQLHPRKDSFTINGGDTLPSGYYEISFTFGLKEVVNSTGFYPQFNEDLRVPSNLGGGYYFMKLDGKFLDASNNEQEYKLCANRAVDISNPQNLLFTDTSFKINLGQHYINGDVFYAAVKVKVDISQWFKNPNTWDLNAINNNLTENYEAQLRLGENVETVFSYIGVETD